MSGSRRNVLLRWVAPVAFLALVTIVVVLVHVSFSGGDETPAPATTAKSTATTHTAPARTSTAAGGPKGQYYTVESGDTFSSIAVKEGTSVAKLEQLNPGVSSNALQVGQKLRVK
ncbi:MAG TPA: LysM domain-containing protein [Thermoleophilaceae bacterium]|jgi:LysM repeat protein